MRKFPFLPVVIPLLLSPASVVAETLPQMPPQYLPIDLGTLPGDNSSWGSGINALGQVVGVSNFATNAPHAFVYSNGTMSPIPTMPGFPYSTGLSINDAGQIVGIAYDSYASPSITRGYIYSNGVISDIGSLTGAGDFSTAASINDSGQVTGTSSAPSGTGHAYIYANGVMTDIGTLPGGSNSIGVAINSSGEVTGNSDGHPFIYANGLMTDISRNGGLGFGTAINASGQVVGFEMDCCTSTARPYAFLYSNSVVTDLGTLPGYEDSYAEGINDLGQITGYSDVDSTRHAFIYSNGVMTDLNSLIDPSLGIVLIDAEGINDLGQIAATGINSAGREDAFLLTPIPEPSTFLLAAGALLFAMHKKGRLGYPRRPAPGSTRKE